ncbi:MAG TPA: hypothetical protein PKY59_21050 [Pyrinomonadaceae bacterium]|nr:hypothetical protein [Pyrinomonadaceae bacterium]
MSNNSTVILLMNRTSNSDGKFIRNWLEKSRFLSCEATDIFQAIETISDFTNSYKPEVVLLEVDSINDDLPMLQQIADFTSGETAIPFMAFAETKQISVNNNFFSGNIKQLETRLDLLFPEHFHFQAAA